MAATLRQPRRFATTSSNDTPKPDHRPSRQHLQEVKAAASRQTRPKPRPPKRAMSHISSTWLLLHPRQSTATAFTLRHDHDHQTEVTPGSKATTMGRYSHKGNRHIDGRYDAHKPDTATPAAAATPSAAAINSNCLYSAATITTSATPTTTPQPC